VYVSICDDDMRLDEGWEEDRKRLKYWGNFYDLMDIGFFIYYLSIHIYLFFGYTLMDLDCCNHANFYCSSHVPINIYYDA
jgi:hypothetical protein